MEKLIKIVIITVSSISSIFFFAAGYNVWITHSAPTFSSSDRFHLVISVFSIITLLFSIPACSFWFKLLLFNKPIIFKPPNDKSASSFLKPLYKKAKFAFIYSVFLLITVILFLFSVVGFSLDTNYTFRLVIIFGLYSLPFIFIFIVSKKAFKNIKALQ